MAQPLDLRRLGLNRRLPRPDLHHVGTVHDLRQPTQDLFRDDQLAQHARELVHQDLLPRIGFRTLSAPAGAVVVDVLPLLEFRDHTAPTVATGHQPGEWEIAAHRPSVIGLAAVEDSLHLGPSFGSREWLMDALVDDVVPVELPHVDSLAEDLLEGADVELLAPHHHADLAGVLHQPLQAVMPTSEKVEQLCDHRAVGGVRRDHPLTSGSVSVDVPEGRAAGVDASPGLFRHPLHRFLAEVQGVVPCHQDLDPVDELVTAARLGADYRALFDEVNAHPELVQSGPILDVAIEPIGLLDEDHADPIAVLFEVRQHIRKTGATGGFSCFNVNEFFRDGDVVLVGVFAEKTLLCRDTKPFLLLVRTTDPGIQDCVCPDGGSGCGGRLNAFG